MVRFTVVVFLIIFCISCQDVLLGGSHDKENQRQGSVVGSVPNEASTVQDAQYFDSIKINFDSLRFTGPLKKKVDEKNNTGNALNEVGCDDWELTEEQLIANLKRMSQAHTAYEWFASCSQLPCNYEVTARVNNQDCRMVINAGGYAWIYFKNQTCVFILKETSDDFLTICNPEIEGSP